MKITACVSCFHVSLGLPVEEPDTEQMDNLYMLTTEGGSTPLTQVLAIAAVIENPNAVIMQSFIARRGETSCLGSKDVSTDILRLAVRELALRMRGE